MSNPVIAAMRRRLDRWELAHLRTHAAELAGQVEALQGEIEALRTRCEQADDRADWALESLCNLQSQIAETGGAVGLTVDGQIGLIQPAAATVPA